MKKLTEPLPDLFSASRRLILNFGDIPTSTPADESIAVFFQEMKQKGLNPRSPSLRQKFNNRLLTATGKRYLVSNYGEDRYMMLEGSSIAKEGRTIHLGIDVFSKDLEPVLAPCDGTIVRVGREPQDHSFGHYVIIQPDDSNIPLLFFGHLSSDLPQTGKVSRGQTIGQLGGYENGENGGWSRHLHLQMLSNLPPKDEAPIGYASQESFKQYAETYPNPLPYFPGWHLK